MRRGVFRAIDYPTLAIMVVLSAVGLWMISAATNGMVPHDPLYYVRRQLLWIALGPVALVIAASTPYEVWARISKYLYGVSLLLLAVAIVKGHAALGASRWISVGPFDLQPSEFAKLSIIITLADHLTNKASLDRFRDLLSPIAHVVVPVLLILKEPDLGTSLAFVAVLVGMLYMAGAPSRRLLLVFGGTLAIVVLWIYAHFNITIGHHQIPIPMQNYQLKRLLIFLNPYQDPYGSGYNVIQSKIAVGAGGLFGVWLTGQSAMQLTFLPSSQTDFIFAVVAYELGFVGSATVVLLYVVLLWRGLWIARSARDKLGTLIATGVVSMVGFHVVESVGMATGVMPVAGVPLPFISYGGSSYLADSFAMGLMMNVFARRNVPVSDVNEVARRARRTRKRAPSPVMEEPEVPTRPAAPP